VVKTDYDISIQYNSYMIPIPNAEKQLLMFISLLLFI